MEGARLCNTVTYEAIISLSLLRPWSVWRTFCARSGLPPFGRRLPVVVKLTVSEALPVMIAGFVHESARMSTNVVRRCAEGCPDGVNGLLRSGTRERFARRPEIMGAVAL